MNDKFKMSKADSKTLVNKNMVDYIYQSARLEGCPVSYIQTDSIVDSHIVTGVHMKDIITIVNLKHAWEFILDCFDYPQDIKMLHHLNSMVGKDLINGAGFIRRMPIRVGGTKWFPDIPEEYSVTETLGRMYSNNTNSTEKAIDIMLYLMRSQLYIDGNRRTAMLAANHLMYQAGSGFIRIPEEHHAQFFTLLIHFYESNDNSRIKQFVYDNCIDGYDTDYTTNEFPE